MEPAVPRAQSLGPVVVAAYAAVGAVGAGLAVAFGHEPLETASWVGLEGTAGVLWSVAMGIVLGVGTVLATRVAVRHTRWARELHVALRPAVKGAKDVTLVFMALASGVAEELLFRGFLMQTVGVIASSIAFGLLHQVRGRARWVWAVWACAMGALFGIVFGVTGSLAGAIVAHVIVNGANLRFLRDVEVRGTKPRAFTDLLRRA